MLALLALFLATTGTAPEVESFTLYKLQQRVGVERSYITRDAGGTEIRTVFSFSDRSTSVPLASILRLGKGGQPLRFQLFGSTSRGSELDDLVVVHGKTLSITRRGATRTAPAPARFFLASAYAPVIVIQELLRHWAAQGRPAHLPVFPLGEVTVVERGHDTMEDDDGKPRLLTRYALGGVGWGNETVWVDEQGRLAALKGVDAEYDHFEATRGFSGALSRLVARAAEDGMAALAEMARAFPGAGDGPVAYLGGRLVDGTGAPPVPDAAVVVAGGKIVAAGPRSSVAVPAGARTVDARGKTVLPGLWDMHAHVEQVEWGPVYLAAGVTTVRDCGNELDFVRSVRDAIEAGRGLGPRILLACLVDGDGQGAVGAVRLRSAEQIPALVSRFQQAGCAQVKIYSHLDPGLIAPLARAAHAAGMTVTGHVPDGINAIHAVEAGMDQISHLQFLMQAFLAPDRDTGLSDADYGRAIEAFDPASPAVGRLAAFFASKGTVIDPTMATRELGSVTRDELARFEPGLASVPAPLAPFYEGVSPDRAAVARARFDRFLSLLRLLHRAGVPVVAGTDQAVPGHSLHRELELYVKAGFSPMEAIQAATLVPARVMKREREVGTIEAGKRADLILIDGDPLADISAIRKIALVVAAGHPYQPAPLWKSAAFIH
jgi:imidazolonepropionase-like amidohydrolase